MKKLLLTLNLTLSIAGLNILFARPYCIDFSDSCYAASVRSDSSAVDAFSDSLAYALNAGDYDKSYSYVLLLSQRDTLSSDALYDCAYCMMSKGKYEECLAFCDKWQNKIPDNNYEELFLPLRGECCYNLKDYDQALQYIIRYDQLLADMGERPSYRYLGMYAETLHKLNMYEKADEVYQRCISAALAEENLQFGQAYLSDNKRYVGQKLYEYAYNSFFMGDEDKGMMLLHLADLCGNVHAWKDFAHLSNCETVGMVLDFKQKYVRQFSRYLDLYDFHYSPSGDSTVNIAEDFWNEMLKMNRNLQELEKDLNKKKCPKMLDRAILVINSGRVAMQRRLDRLTVVRYTSFTEDSSSFNENLIDKVTGGNNLLLSDFEVYASDDVNAFATPYGQIYLTSGLVSRYNFSHPLLIGVLAHEMTHSLCSHSLVELWRQYEKERRTRVWAGVAAGLYAAAMGVAAGMASSGGIGYNQSYYDDIGSTAVNLFYSIDASSFYFQFKYSRSQEIESDIIAYRFCEAIGIGGYAYIMALQLLDENDLYMKAEKTDEHPTLAYRISFLKWLYAQENGVVA